MIRASLAELLLEGRLGPIGVGVLRADVLSWLGEPTDEGERKRRDSDWLYKFGDFEFYFDGKTERLYELNVHAFEGVPSLGTQGDGQRWGEGKRVMGEPRAVLDAGPVHNGFEKAAFLAWLDSLGVAWRQTAGVGDTRFLIGPANPDEAHRRFLVIFVDPDSDDGWTPGFHGLWLQSHRRS